MPGRRDRGTARRDVLRSASGALAAALAGCPAIGDSRFPATDAGSPPERSPRDSRPEVHFRTDYDTLEQRHRWEEKLIPAFRAETGLEVQPIYPSYEDARLETRLEAGNLDIESLQFGQLVSAWSVANPQPVTSIVDAAVRENGDLLATPYTVGGEARIVPHGYYAETFQYREDVYDRLGLSAPISFRGVLENARAIDESGLEIRGYGLAAERYGKSRDEFQAYLARMGTSPIGLRWRDPDARDVLEIDFPRDRVTELLAFLRELARYAPAPTEHSWQTARSGWIEGDFAQQLHLNNWAAGVAGASVSPRFDITPATVARTSAVAPLPYWEAGGIARGDAWVWEPLVDGHVVFKAGPNTAGAERWLRWLYGEDAERTGSLYTGQRGQFMPAYADVLETDTVRNGPLFRQWPRLYDVMRFIQETIVGDHYRQTEEAAFDDPVALAVGRKWFYGEMVHHVVAGERSPAEAYDWGRDRLEKRLAEARETFR